MSQDEILTLTEGMLAKVMKDVKGIDIELPFRRFKYVDAMNRFGSDKTDTRFNLELVDVTEVFRNSQFRALKPV